MFLPQPLWQIWQDGRTPFGSQLDPANELAGIGYMASLEWMQWKSGVLKHDGDDGADLGQILLDLLVGLVGPTSC